MEHNELIKILKEPSIKVMEEQLVPASILIGLSILILDNEDFSTIKKKLIDGNNPYAEEEITKAGTKSKNKKIYNDKNKTLYRTFSSMEESITYFITTHQSIFKQIRGIADYKRALIRTDGLTEDQREELQLVIEEYRLYEYDTVQVDAEDETPIIEVDTAKTKETLDKVAEAVSNINKDIKKKDPVKPVVNTSKFSEVIKKNDDDTVRKENCKVGTKIHVLRANLYNSIYDKVPTRSITGEYYLYSGVEKYQRYAIVSKKEFVGKHTDYILGYIDYDEFDIIKE